MGAEVFQFWNEQAPLGAKAGSQDTIAAELERRAILAHMTTGIRVLDVGCGTGETAEAVADLGCQVTGWDYSPDMITATVGKRGVNFAVVDVRDCPAIVERYQVIYTQRCIINLSDWQTQERVIRYLLGLLVPGGMYLMCECSADGLADVNELRARVGLQPIHAPWHNRYLENAEIGMLARGVKSDEYAELEGVEYPLSTYALLSRVVNAALAQQARTVPDYQSPVNRLALDLPAMGTLGQNRLWIWRKM